MVTYDSANGEFDADTLTNLTNSIPPTPACPDDIPDLSGSSDHNATVDALFDDSDYASDINVLKAAWLANIYSFPPVAGQTFRILPLGGKHLSKRCQ